MTGASEAQGQPTRWLFLVAWLLASLVFVLTSWQAITTWKFPDPDDTLRLVQVRDWLAGQSWWDITQYRMNPPDGGDMHWSRLVDLPIAAIILLLRPFLGAEGAEHGALILVPLLTLGVVMALTAKLTERLLDRRLALLGIFMLPVLAAVFAQLRPMRIDHHGWQLALALGTALALLDRKRLRGSLAAGALTALWLNISLEGLPFAASVMALLALRWVADPKERAPFAAAAGALALVSLLLFGLTRNPSLWSTNHCDAVSPGYLGLLGIGAVGTAALVWLAPLSGGGPRGVTLRLGGLGAVAVAAAATLLFIAPACSGGPFVKLDPLVHELWYLSVGEGLPIWHQSWPAAVHAVGVPLVGLLGSFLLWRDAEGERKRAWTTMLFLLGAATLTALLVQRASGAANLLAIPGAIWLFRAAVDAALASRSGVKRIAGVAASVLLLVPGQVTAAGARALEGKAEAQEHVRRCAGHEEARALNALPAATIVAPLDIAPSILEASHHRIIASGHHRNAEAMRDTMRIFILPPDEARAVIQGRGATYVALCPGFAELDHYRKENPAGLSALIEAGQVPVWLEPVKVEGVTRMSLWRVRGD